MKNFLKTAVILMMVIPALTLVSCEKDEESKGPVTNSIVDVASKNPNFSILVDAVKKAGLVGALSDQSARLTVFAPTNTAFQSLLTELGYASLNDVPVDALKNILLYHVIGEQKMSSAITTGYYSSLSPGPANDLTVSMYIDKAALKINNRAAITQADVMADNGVIHVIDKVILPLSVTGHAVANSSFSALVAAVTKADLAGALDNASGRFTVFAPVDAAFTQFLTGLGVTLNDLTAEALSPILLYHVLGSVVKSSDVATGYVPTLSTAQSRNVSLYVQVASGVKLNNSSNVVVTDVVATNGIIHAIDKVIVPPTVVDIALANSNFTHLVQAVVRAGLVDALNGDGPFTVFAPTNAAFEALFTSLGVSGVEGIDLETLTAVLLGHVVSGNVASSALSNGTVPTLNGDQTLAIGVGSGVTINGNINVVLADIQGKNGIVHVINKVILP